MLSLEYESCDEEGDFCNHVGISWMAMTVIHRCPWFFFRGGGVKPHPLECQKFFSGGKVGGPGGK